MGKIFLRVLSGIIDSVLIFIPSYMLLEVLQLQGAFYGFVPQLLFVIYQTICVLSFEGKTIGKYFGHLSAYSEEGGIYLGVRELAKLLYFLPTIGVLFLLLNIPCYLKFQRSFHDLLGKSEVLLDRERFKLSEETN